LYPRRSPIRLLGREEVTADIDVRFLEEQSAVWSLEHTHTAGHKPDVAGDRHTTSKIHIRIAILTETKVKQ
jgi:hypothetical protein